MIIGHSQYNGDMQNEADIDLSSLYGFVRRYFGILSEVFPYIMYLLIYFLGR